MRTRPAFRPAVEFMPTRLAPSGTFGFGAPCSLPSTIVVPATNPFDPCSTPTAPPNPSDPSGHVIIDAGSPTPLTPGGPTSARC